MFGKYGWKTILGSALIGFAFGFGDYPGTIGTIAEICKFVGPLLTGIGVRSAIAGISVVK